MALPRRVRLAAAWLLGLYLASLYVRMGWGKLASGGFWAESFARWSYPSWLRVLVGAIEVAAGAALIVPWVASYGALALSLVMAGAWGTLAHEGRWGDVAWVTAYGAGLTWIAYEWWGRRLGGGAK
jgi:uncharacterized membrane protein YphA (DoxX/SURF4 family)